MTVNDRIELADEQSGPSWSLFAAGDCYLQTESRAAGEPAVSESLADRIERADLSVGNLEAPIRGERSEPIRKSGPNLASDPTAHTQLAEVGFDLLTLANNHTMDYGWPSLQRTIDACRDVGLETTGAGENSQEALTPARFTIAGCDVAVLSICEQEFGVASGDRPGTAWSGQRDAMETIRACTASADTVIVVAHGGIEYVPLPPPQWRDRLCECIDNGADLVIAHHPHVPQGFEQYGEGTVFYSLGNFIFDSQTDPATRWGLALDIEFAGPTPLSVDLVPTERHDGVVHPLDSSEETIGRTERIEYLHRLSRITATELRPYWQSIAVRKLYETYSTWLLSGTGDNLARANAHPFESDAHQSLWNPDRRRDELLVLLNVIRNESHRAVVTDALSVLTGETDDTRTEAIESEVEELLSLTTPER